MKIAIRVFQEQDVTNKVKWINDEANNKYLHYDLPLEKEKTLNWFKTLNYRNDRVDYIITCNQEAVGLIGLLNINLDCKDAEYYICIGEQKFKGKGIANVATDLLIKKALNDLNLDTIYLYTEFENKRAQTFFESFGFKRIGLIKNNLFYNGKFLDRYYYTLDIKNYINNVGVL